MRGDSSSPDRKRARFVTDSSMEFNSVKERIAAVKDKYGREIRVFETSTASVSTTDSTDVDMQEADAFYEFTAEDYYRLMASKKEGIELLLPIPVFRNYYCDLFGVFESCLFRKWIDQMESGFESFMIENYGLLHFLELICELDKHLKTKKIRDAEEAARRARMTKTTIRVRFPDNHTLEVSFHPSETINSLVELLKKALLHPERSFYIYTTPPKKQIKDLSQDFYSVGFVPGAIVYFSYDLPKDGADRTPIVGPYLKEDIMSLKGLEYPIQPEETEAQTTTNSSASAQTSTSEIPEQKSADKKKIKPKWLKM